MSNHISGDRVLQLDDKLKINTIKMVGNELLDYIELLSREPDKHDVRWLAIARTNLQLACMAATRAVAKPEGV